MGRHGQRSEKLPSAYLSPSSQPDMSGRSDLMDRYAAARHGAEKLLAAVLRYYERRVAG